MYVQGASLKTIIVSHMEGFLTPRSPEEGEAMPTNPDMPAPDKTSPGFGKRLRIIAFKLLCGIALIYFVVIFISASVDEKLTEIPACNSKEFSNVFLHLLSSKTNLEVIGTIKTKSVTEQARNNPLTGEAMSECVVVAKTNQGRKGFITLLSQEAPHAEVYMELKEIGAMGAFLMMTN